MYIHALYYLAANPEYAEPLRHESEVAIQENGWTKTAVMKMQKLDSFVKEAIRLNPLGYSTFLVLQPLTAVAVSRLVVGEGFTFSNGIFVPRGEVIGTPVFATHTDDNIYPNGKEFDGFRFSRMREQEGESAKHHASNTSLEFMTFGHGQHAW